MTWRDFARIGGGVAFGVLGLAGLVLPILQGILFLLVAVFLLTPYSLFMQRQQARLEARFPRLTTRAHALIGWVEARFARRG